MFATIFVAFTQGLRYFLPEHVFGLYRICDMCVVFMRVFSFAKNY